ncbi:MAG: hypothetical protein H6713_36715 [Myxococcales bacterium]|nr:hypothetical protein [Myxococcales bacterium]
MSWGRTNRLIAQAAARLGVTAEPLSRVVHTDFLMRLRHRSRAVIISKTRSPFLSQVAQTLSNNKYVSRELIAREGVPVVPSVMVQDDDDPRAPAVRELLARRGAVFVKPNGGNRGFGVSGPHRALDAVARAVDWARAEDRDCEAIVEPFLTGANLRVAVVGGRAIAAAEIQRPTLRAGAVSCGEQIAELNRDSRRARAHDELRGLDVIPSDDVVREQLRVHGLSLDARLSVGQTIELLSEEAEIIDQTDALHPGWRELAERACARLGVDVGGVDLRGPLAAFTRRPTSDGAAALLEVNVLPALHLHALPTRGRPRPVFEAFVAYCLSLPGAPAPCASVPA